MNVFHKQPPTQRERTNGGKTLRLYLKDISRIPLLTVDEERELGKRAQEGDKQSLQKLIECNLRFVIKIAKKYQKSGLPLTDLINEGNLGLIEAACRFDPGRNVRFTSYAIWWIRQSILHYLAQQGQPFRISPRTANILYRLGVATARSKAEKEGKPDRRQLAVEIGVSLRELDDALSAVAGTFSLDQPMDEDGELYLAETLEQKTIPSAESVTATDHLRRQVQRALRVLSRVEQEVVRLRFGLADDTPLTLKQIGERLELSRERIRQIESQALGKLRRSSVGRSLECYMN